MIELRWHVSERGLFLQHRILMPAVDASGALAPGHMWTEWKVVPVFIDKGGQDGNKEAAAAPLPPGA